MYIWIRNTLIIATSAIAGAFAHVNASHIMMEKARPLVVAPHTDMPFGLMIELGNGFAVGALGAAVILTFWEMDKCVVGALCVGTMALEFQSHLELIHTTEDLNGTRWAFANFGLGLYLSGAMCLIGLMILIRGIWERIRAMI